MHLRLFVCLAHVVHREAAPAPVAPDAPDVYSDDDVDDDFEVQVPSRACNSKKSNRV